eukprot:31144-Pelagococcus_subviridis.AAC.6
MIFSPTKRFDVNAAHRPRGVVFGSRLEDSKRPTCARSSHRFRRRARCATGCDAVTRRATCLS